MINQAELLWKRRINRGSSLEVNLQKTLNLQPGARDEDLQLIETTLGITLPKEMKSFYRVYNGQIWAPGSESCVRNLVLFPT
ncbi:SMI1/KNR4 family protein, partial [Bacillus pseudomycoides]|uniref:SMI1/KNR4 family protein n=1 Tax=Bacillus pseudomycoides TaxID=64104 RepID=UPI0028419A4D